MIIVRIEINVVSKINEFNFSYENTNKKLPDFCIPVYTFSVDDKLWSKMDGDRKEWFKYSQ